MNDPSKPQPVCPLLLAAVLPAFNSTVAMERAACIGSRCASWHWRVAGKSLGRCESQASSVFEDPAGGTAPATVGGLGG